MPPKKAAGTGGTAVAGASGTPGTVATGGVAGSAPGGAVPANGTLASLGLAASLPPTGGKDPFIQVGQYFAAQTRAAATPAPPPTPQSIPSASPLPGTPKFSNLAFDENRIIREREEGSAPGFAGTTQPAAFPAPTPSPSPTPLPGPPPYIVTGVVVADRDVPGSRSIAVLRAVAGIVSPVMTAAFAGSGNTSGSASSSPPAGGMALPERRFVGVGDPVGNGFVVASVRADGVDLRNGKRVVTLKIGTNPGNVK